MSTKHPHGTATVAAIAFCIGVAASAAVSLIAGAINPPEECVMTRAQQEEQIRLIDSMKLPNLLPEPPKQ